MKSALEQFAWARPAEGYAWEDSVTAKLPGSDDEANDREETRFLLWRDSKSSAVGLAPLHDNPTLFREFARLEPTESAFLDFANQYGWLGVSRMLRGTPSEDGKTITIHFGDPRSQGEPLWRWRRAHRKMRGVSAVVEAIQNRDVATLGQWFQIRPNGVFYERTEPVEWEWVCAQDPPLKTWLWNWGKSGADDNEQMIRFASGWAQKQINDAMSDRSSDTATSVRVLLNDERNGMMVHIVPGTLLAAMWLQCARALAENPTFKACEHCGKWFEIAPDARRKNTKYCSPRCKVAAHRAMIPVTCDHCGANFKVGVAVSSGYINHQDVTCPKCGQANNRLLPGELREVR